MRHNHPSQTNHPPNARRKKITELPQRQKSEPFYKSLTATAWVTLGAVVVIILFYLLTHHKTHVLDVLPYILILAMILMHVGGHGGHNHGGKHGG